MENPRFRPLKIYVFWFYSSDWLAKKFRKNLVEDEIIFESIRFFWSDPVRLRILFFENIEIVKKTFRIFKCSSWKYFQMALITKTKPCINGLEIFYLLIFSIILKWNRISNKVFLHRSNIKIKYYFKEKLIRINFVFF